MIFKQVQEIVNGTKTETRRIVKPGEELGPDFGGELTVFTKQGRIKWQVGRDYAVVPKRSYRGVWYDVDTGMVYGHGYFPWYDAIKTDHSKIPLRYKITGIRSEPLQSITRKGAIAEGMNGFGNVILGYSRLWEQINGAGSWDKNPHVWVIKFEVLRLNDKRSE